MANEDKLIIPIYLNQKIVFDMLAILEDGFSQIRNIQKKISEEDNISSNVDGEIGTSNIFALLGVRLKAGLRGEQKSASDKLVNEERIHTPASLFAKLLEKLNEKQLIKDLKSKKDLDEIKPGDFVSFKGTLAKNPLISLLESVSRMMELVVLFDDNNPNQSGGKKGKRNNNPNKTLINQINGLTVSLKTGGMIDILCKIKDEKNLSAVLQTYINYFYNKSMNEIIDGEYTVLGKVVKIVKEEDNNSINLLRNTSLSLANEKLMDQFTTVFKSKEIENAGLEIPDVKTKIYSNGVLIIPISIYT